MRSNNNSKWVVATASTPTTHDDESKSTKYKNQQNTRILTGTIAMMMVVLLIVILYRAMETAKIQDTKPLLRRARRDEDDQIHAKVKEEEEEVLQQTTSSYSQLKEEEEEEDTENRQRRNAVRNGFIHAWKGYETYAFGYDTLKPISRRGENDFLEMATTLVDSMDTALIMGLDDIVQKQLEWTKDNLIFNGQKAKNVFETTIRILGCLLTMHTLVEGTVHEKYRPMILKKAIEVGNALMPAFSTSSGYPHGTLDFGTTHAFDPTGAASVSEAGTLTLEFRELSRLSGDPKYEKAIMKVMQMIKSTLDGFQIKLFSLYMRPESGWFDSGIYTFGARVDSIYEYFLKAYIQTSETEPIFKDMYVATMNDMKKHLLRTTNGPLKLMYIGEGYGNSHVEPKVDHLVCFMPGLLALGTRTNNAPDIDKEDHMNIAKGLMEMCYKMYEMMPLKLAPEISHLNQPGQPELIAKNGAHHCMLRPEAVESLFIMWRITKDQKYREYAWKIFEAIEKYARVENGYSSIHDVTHSVPQHSDKMESFFLAETLKYLYLIFCDDSVVSLDQFVFNTEAHPLPIIAPKKVK